MVAKSTKLVFWLFCLGFARCQRFNLFSGNVDEVRSQNADRQHSDELRDDPFVRELFKEFLIQYKQLSAQEKPQPPTPVALTTSRPTPPTVLIQQPTTTSAQPIPQTNRQILTHTTARPQQRRVTSRRKPRPPQQVTESFPQRESTTLPSLRSKYFAIQTTTAGNPNLEVFRVQKAKPEIAIVPSSRPRIASPSKDEQDIDEELFRKQAQNAKYEFASDISDDINGNVHQREEVRDGLAVKGKYSYSDGYYKRTVHYEADEKGYRVIKEEVEPLDGPTADPQGRARVSTYVSGNTLNYEITADDILKRNDKFVFDGFSVENEENAGH